MFVPSCSDVHEIVLDCPSQFSGCYHCLLLVAIFPGRKSIETVFLLLRVVISDISLRAISQFQLVQA